MVDYNMIPLLADPQFWWGLICGIIMTWIVLDGSGWWR